MIHLIYRRSSPLRTLDKREIKKVYHLLHNGAFITMKR